MAAHQRLRTAAHSSSLLLEFLIQREEYYPIFDRICSSLGIGDIVSLTRTCKSLSSVYQVLLTTQWNVDRALRRFVKDPCLFRSKLGEYDALVSGSFALQFFDRVIWPESDLDIFMRVGAQKHFEEYLCQSEGYTLNTETERVEDTLSKETERDDDIYPMLNNLEVNAAASPFV